MSMITNGDCTIFHKTYDEATDTETFTRFYVPSCFWYEEDNVTQSEDGFEKSDKLYVLIPNNSALQLSKFKKITAYDKESSGFWTVDNEDKIVKGDIPGTIDLGTLEQEYDDVLTVTKVSDNQRGSVNMHHIEVGGK